MERWEHMEISVGADDMATLPTRIEDLGCYGWELAGLAGTVLGEVVIAVLKRPWCCRTTLTIVSRVGSPIRAVGGTCGGGTGRHGRSTSSARAMTETIRARCPTMQPVFKQPKW
jgi:hypothetical protein